MQINTIQSIHASEFFREFVVIQDYLSFCFNWGDGVSHTLVDIDTIVREIGDRIDVVDEIFDGDEGSISVFYWKQFLVHAGTVPSGVYIDLEN